jgi:5-(carboxyamino)imidazole ribonucleotide synthase
MVQRVGVIGGGQLAWMMADAAAKLGVKLVVQTPKPTDPAVSIAAQSIFDVITFENEFINLDALQRLEQQGVRFYPRLASLAPLLDKYHQRSYLRDRGLPTPDFMALEAASVTSLEFPAVLKSRRLGYDGQGTFIVKDAEHLNMILQQQGITQPGHWLLEAFVPFERELAVMAARSAAGEVVVYPVVETQQEQQVCRRVIATRDLELAVTQQVEAIAQTLLHSLEFIGIMGIEFFLTSSGHVLVNETAPRTHNSGHYSLDACVTSQFEQHLRAVCQLPLGDPSLQAEAVMVNLLGFETAERDYAEQRQQLAQLPHAHVYWYGKTQSRPGRKLGHVTVLLPEGGSQGRSAALQAVAAIETIWYG